LKNPLWTVRVLDYKELHYGQSRAKHTCTRVYVDRF
jgi:hypothetical protein